MRPNTPRALRLPAGQGRVLRQQMATLARTLQTGIPKRLGTPDFKAECERIDQTYASQEDLAYAELSAFAAQRHFGLRRDEGELVFTLLGDQGQVLTEAEVMGLPPEQRARHEADETALRGEINRFLDKTAPLERDALAALAALRRRVIKPLVESALQAVREALKKQIKDTVKLGRYLDQVAHDVLDNIELFELPDADDEAHLTALVRLLQRYQVNLVVDNGDLRGAPVVCENNPVHKVLFGSVEYQAENDVLMTDFSRIRAGSLHRAHGGYLVLHLRDLLGDDSVWEKLRRFLRHGRVQIEEPGLGASGMASVSLEPEAVDVEVKLILIGAPQHYYALQESAEGDLRQHFRVKVELNDRFVASADSYAATAQLVGRWCRAQGWPHFEVGAVAALLEASHREAEDQARQSAVFAQLEALCCEAAAHCRQRGGSRVDAQDVHEAQWARRLRHNAPERSLHESVADGERLISLVGTQVGQLNALTQIDLGDYQFGFPVRLTARSFAGQEGVLNIEREVDMSGPIHDKGVMILHSYLSALFAHLAPLALSASVVFEQEYSGVEGDSASCAELYALLSSLSGVALRQGIAVTGAVNQFGEVLLVGGLNEKIEGYFEICRQAGFTGEQGVLIPRRNQRHLMLHPDVAAAVTAGQFQVYTADHVLDGLALLTGQDAGTPDARGHYPEDSVLGRAQARLKAFRRACRRAQGGRGGY